MFRFLFMRLLKILEEDFLMDTYINRTILEEIDKKINSIDRTRTNRINASERMYKYEKHWNLIFFVMNIEAVVYLIFSLVLIPTENNLLIISGVFSLYVIILQYYRSILNYSERGLKLHYQQIELERCIFKLKSLLQKKYTMNEQEIEKNYQTVMNLYLTNLIGTENHSNYDDSLNSYSKAKNKAKKENYDDNVHVVDPKPLKKFKHYIEKKPADYSIDNILIYSNYIVAIVIYPVIFILNIF